MKINWPLYFYRFLNGVQVGFTTTTNAIELSLGGSSPYTSTDKTNKNKYT